MKTTSILAIVAIIAAIGAVASVPFVLMVTPAHADRQCRFIDDCRGQSNHDLNGDYHSGFHA
jgi:hypothetical protein